jgi:hypothetical protein
MNRISILRTNFSDKQTLGKLFVLDENSKILFECFTLELPWKNNQKQISCIPAGIYRIRPRVSAKYGNHLHILDVPKRDFILIHEANYVHQLQGCIAVGQKLSDLNGDGLLDTTSSKLTKMRLLEYMDGETTIEIK